MTKAAFTLFVVGQLLRALIALNGSHATTSMPVPADNVTIAGLESDVQVINQRDPSYIKPMGQYGFVVPTTTAIFTTTRGLNPVDGSMYSVCPGYTNGGAPSNSQC